MFRFESQYFLFVCVALCAFAAQGFQVAQQQPNQRTRHNQFPSSSPLSYSNTVDAVQAADAGFEARMRNLVLPKQQKKTQIQDPHSSTHLPNVRAALNIGDYRELVGEESERVTVVRFYAPWCQACQRSLPFFERLVSLHPDVNFVTVPMSDSTKQLLSGLEIPKIPYTHIYHPTEGLTEELSMNKKVFKHLNKIVESYVRNECELSDDVNPETGIFEAPYERHQ